MDVNPVTNTDDAYILDEDVMEEMENLEATVVLTEEPDWRVDTVCLDREFLDDIEAATDES